MAHIHHLPPPSVDTFAESETSNLETCQKSTHDGCPSPSKSLKKTELSARFLGGFGYKPAIFITVASLLFIAGKMPKVAERSKKKSVFNYTDGASNELPTRPIKQISILGERNSGTRWIYSHLGTCFNHTIPVKKRLTRYKHWFQYDAKENIPNSTLVIAQFRNPYEWIEAMRKIPHHATEHIDLEWKEFVTKPWTMERVGLDLEMKNTTGRVCQENFHYHEVISCNAEPFPEGYFKEKQKYLSRHQPCYEMRNDGSGQPYSSILEMRSDKIRNFMEVKRFEGVHALWTVQYEYFLKRGTEALIRKIEKETGVEAKCSMYPPQNRPVRKIEKSLIRYLDAHLDWDTEKLVGYSKKGRGAI